MFNRDIDNEIIEGSTNELFSVSPTQKVYFAKGNLQYNLSQGLWRFAEDQWGSVGYHIGRYYGRKLPAYNGWMDLFLWGTGKNPKYMYGEKKSFVDWGNNKIFNGGSQENQWRTLDKDEWDYVFEKRQTASGIRYAKAQLNDVNGIVLFPDNWSETIYKFDKTNQATSDFKSNILTSVQWKASEHAGATFLPAGGLRLKTDVWNTENYGTYWSSSCDEHGLSFSMEFDDNHVCTAFPYIKTYGRLVRLVHPA